MPSKNDSGPVPVGGATFLPELRPRRRYPLVRRRHRRHPNGTDHPQPERHDPAQLKQSPQPGPAGCAEIPQGKNQSVSNRSCNRPHGIIQVNGKWHLHALQDDFRANPPRDA